MSSIIHASSLSYAYPSLIPDQKPVWALQDINLDITAGAFVSIMGPNGAGITTLCLALNGIVPQLTGGVIRGDVTVCGKNTKQQHVPDLAEKVGLVFQDTEAQIFNTSVENEIAFGLENQGLPPQEIKKRVAWALSTVGMETFRHKSPARLSGGQKKRVAIAATLALLPEVLVLDEPTANLDPLGRIEVITLLRKLCAVRQMTVVMGTHDADLAAEFSDRVIVLEGGRIVMDGAPQDIFSQAQKLQAVGLDIPQAAGLAVHLNQRYRQNFSFYTIDQAQRALSSALGRPGAGALQPGRVEILPPRSAASQPQEAACLEAREVWFGYEAKTPVLKGISFSIAPGEFTAIMGLNGCGKTTLAKQFNGLLRPQRGAVLVDGKDIQNIPISEMAHSVGYIFQNPDHQIFSSTTRQEIAFGLKNLGWSEGAIRQRTAQVLEEFNLYAFAESQPAALSFSLRRKISIAAVYAMSPQVLVLDEPTTGLDWKNTSELMQRLAACQQQGHTILLITHDMRLAASYIPRCLVMSAGQVLFHGETRAFFADHDLLEKAHLGLPPVYELAQRLAAYGFRQPVLNLQDFADVYGQLLELKEYGCADQ